MKQLWDLTVVFSYLSLLTIGLQAALTLAGILWVEHLGLNQNYDTAAAAAALMIALGTASLVKAWMLGRFLRAPVNTWRWALVWAVAAASAVGWAATRFLPEWAELTLGIAAILGVYCWVIWHKGFGPEDRGLFRKNVAG